MTEGRVSRKLKLFPDSRNLLFIVALLLNLVFQIEIRKKTALIIYRSIGLRYMILGLQIFWLAIFSKSDKVTHKFGTNAIAFGYEDWRCFRNSLELLRICWIENNNFSTHPYCSTAIASISSAWPITITKLFLKFETNLLRLSFSLSSNLVLVKSIIRKAKLPKLGNMKSAKQLFVAVLK